jgi:hypothetical protein
MTRGSPAVTKRVARALDGFFHVEPGSDPGEYRVHSGSRSTYTVTLPEGTCTCPDGQRGPWCKHTYRALFVTGFVPEIGSVPADTDSDTHIRETADHIEPTDAEVGVDDDKPCKMLAKLVNRFRTNNPDASAIEVISQLGIDPTNRERVEELLAQ